MKRFLFILSLFALVSVSAPVGATGNPVGNNGFVKVSNEIIKDEQPQNHPHVSCTFKVEFYNYDKNNSYANVKFELQAPTDKDEHSVKVTSGNLKPFIGSDKAGGSNDLDAIETYTLKFTGKEHDKQGYHVKLKVNAPGTKGSDNKFKVFWVKPCAEQPQILGDSTTKPTEIPQTGVALGTFGLASAVATISYFVTRLLRKKTS